ncbi:hypothetical protein TNCV_4142991 [Trichonephila clavipes]|nr:hypothetical protein TNCV_4142991 [Trichonephila clavipes]
MFLSGGLTNAKSPVFSSQASLVLIYRLTFGMECRVRPCLARDRTPDLWHGSATRTTTPPFKFIRFVIAFK